jgi:hypothetical protein
VKRTFRRRLAVAAAVVILAAGIAAIPLSDPPPVYATQTTDETDVADDWLFADLDGSGRSDDQGWLRRGAAYFNDGNNPDCALGTGRTPSGHADSYHPTGVYIEENSGPDRSSLRHRVSADKSGTSTDITGDWTYWIHAARDTGSSDWICLHTTVTTDASGYFTVTFPRTLSGTPAMVTWSMSESLTSFRAVGNTVVSASSTGFTGRAYDGAGGSPTLALWGNAKTFEIDYWADTRTHPDTTTGNGNPYEHVAGLATVTTDSNGHATIDHADLSSGQAVGGQVTAQTETTDSSNNVAGGVILSGITPSSSTVHVRNEDGQPVASTTIDLYYVISGYNGGAVRPEWGNYGSHQIAGQAAYTDTGCDGSDDDHACFRLEEWDVSGANHYALMTNFVNEPDVDGITWVTYASNAASGWNNADVNVPSWSRDTTADADDRAWIDFRLENPDECAHVDLGRTPLDDQGFNQIVLTDMVLNNWHDWTKDDDPEDGKCNADGTIAHEMGHVMGLGHADNQNSLMRSAGGLFGVLPIITQDAEDAAGIYGYSGSSFAPGEPKLSTLALAPKGQTVGLATVAEVTKEVVTGTDRLPWTKIHLETADKWAGESIPATAWAKGGTVTNPELGPVFRPLADELAAGARVYVRVDDATGRIMQSWPIETGQVVLKGDHAKHSIDDIGDGGAKDRASVTRVKAAAKVG